MSSQQEVRLLPRREPSPEPAHAGNLILDFQPPELWEALLFISHPVCGILLQQPEQTKKMCQSLSKETVLWIKGV